MNPELQTKIANATPDTKIINLYLGDYYSIHMGTKIEKFCFINEIKTIQELNDFFEKLGGIRAYERSIKDYNNSNLGPKSLEIIGQILKVYNSKNDPS